MSSYGPSPMQQPDPQSILPLARADLGCYAVAIYPGYQLARHHRVLIERLEEVESGKVKRLMIFLPPRHGKSLTASCLFPAWFLGRNPKKSIITASYGAELAEDFGRRVRNIMSDPLHTAIFPDCKLSADAAAQRRFETTAGGPQS